MARSRFNFEWQTAVVESGGLYIELMESKLREGTVQLRWRLEKTQWRDSSIFCLDGTPFGKCYKGSNQLESRSISTVVNVKQPAERPALYVVAIGISKYRDSSLNEGVRFAARDADTIAKRLKQQGTGLFREVIP